MTEMMTAPPLAESSEGVDANRKKLLLVGGGLGILALASAGYLLFGRGGSNSASEATPIVHHVTAVAKVPAKPVVKPATKPATKPAVLPPASTTPLGRDPFKALYVVPVAAAPAAGATTTSTTGTTTAGAPTTGTSTPANGGAAETAPYTLVVKSTDAKNPSLRKWTFTVDGALKTVVTNQKFGKYGELVVLGTATDSQGKIIGALVQVGDAPLMTARFGDKNTVL